MGADGKSELLPPYDHEPAADCCVCMEPLVQCRFFDLPCGHEICVGCCTQWLVTKVRSTGTNCSFECPLCRGNMRVDVQMVDDATVLHNIPFVLPKTRKLHCIEDTFGNYTVIPSSPKHCRTFISQSDGSVFRRRAISYIARASYSSTNQSAVFNTRNDFGLDRSLRSPPTSEFSSRQTWGPICRPTRRR